MDYIHENVFQYEFGESVKNELTAGFVEILMITYLKFIPIYHIGDACLC